MTRNFLRYVFPSLLFVAILPVNAQPQDQGRQTILPAGTLLRCTLNEPNFSSKSAEVGDPVVCALGGMTVFGRNVFPRGAYLVGHLEADKDPGRFIGKGYLKLVFDRIGLPDSQVPVPTKIIASSGYKVDRQGKIIGHGHPTRDLAEWMIPPLWPVKVLTLPERGPRPTLKGEERLTLRLMDDAVIPTDPAPGWHYFSRSSSDSSSRTNDPPPTTHAAPQRPAWAANNPAPRGSSSLGASTASAQSMLVLRNGATYSAASLRIDGDVLRYTLPDGTAARASMEDVDWTQTFKSNAENGTVLALSAEGVTH